MEETNQYFENRQYLDTLTGEIYTRHSNNGSIVKRYYNQDEINRHATKIIKFNSHTDFKRNSYSKIDVYFALKKNKIGKKNFETYVIAGFYQTKSKLDIIPQFYSKDNDDLKAFWSLLYNVSKNDKFKDKCINIICENNVFKYNMKYNIYRFIDAKFKK
ncbi:6652_t:CDS:1, partial [Cetraspora pellucida]